MKKVKQGYKKWTQEEVDIAKSLYENGMNLSEIGRELGRDKTSVRKKLRVLGVHKVEKVEKVYLYDIESVRGHIIDIDEAKTLTHQSHKRIMFQCSTDGCKTTKNMRIVDLVKQGFSCPNCSKGIRYPESFFTAYLEVKGIPYETQVVYEEIPTRRYDFRIVLDGTLFLCETHGEQHYFTEDRTYYKVETIQESDEIKRNYAKNNNINYIELDCRESNFEFIRNSIEDNKYLPNIEDKEIPNMLELMELNSKYPVKKIIKMYKSGKSTQLIGEKLGYDAKTIWNILKRNNVKLRGARAVRCINNGMVFEQQILAAKWCGLKYGTTIGYVCNGKRNYAGKHPITREPLIWEYVDNE